MSHASFAKNIQLCNKYQPDIVLLTAIEEIVPKYQVDQNMFLK